MTCAPGKDSDQPGHPPSLIRVFAVHLMGSLGPKISSCGQRRLLSNWADAQADLSLRWAQRSFCWFCHAAANFHISPEKINKTNIAAGYCLSDCSEISHINFSVSVIQTVHKYHVLRACFNSKVHCHDSIPVAEWAQSWCKIISHAL